MLHPATELRFINEKMGFGVVATRFIPKGTITWVLCKLDRVMTVDEIRTLPDSYLDIMEVYTYVNADGAYVLCWDFGRYVNHSCESTSLALGHEAEIAIRDIHPGEQVTSEYGVLNLSAPLICQCDSVHCRKIIHGEDPKQFGDKWDKSVASVLTAGSGQSQPLISFARNPEKLQSYLESKIPLPSHRSLLYPGLKTHDTPSDARDELRRLWKIPQKA